MTFDAGMDQPAPKLGKFYLGDSVYVDTEYEDVILITENGFGATNRIVLEWPVYEALVKYVDRFRPIVEVQA